MSLVLRGVGANATGTTSVAVSQPAGTSTGDVLIAFILDHATSGTTTAPTGWTRITATSSANGRFQAFIAVVGLNGLTGTSWTWSSLTTTSQGVIIGYSEGSNTQPDLTSSSRSNASGASGSSAIVPVTAGVKLVAAFAALASGSTWSGEALATGIVLTQQFSQANGTSSSIDIADGIKTTNGGGTGQSSATMGTAGVNAGILIALRPVVICYDKDELHTTESLPPGSLGTLQLLSETEQFDWGFILPPGGSGGKQMMGFRGYKIPLAGMDLAVDNWNFNPPVTQVVEIGTDDSIDQYPMSSIATDDVDNFGFNQIVTVAISGFDQDEGIPYGQVISDFSLDDMQIDSPLALDVDQQPLVMSFVSHQVELDQIGQNAPFLVTTSEVWELQGLPSNLPYPIIDQVDDVQSLRGTPFITAQGFDDSQEQFELTVPILDDVDMFSFDLPFVQEDISNPSPTLLILDDVEQFSFNPVTVIVGKIGSDNVEDQLPITRFIVDETEAFNWGFDLPLTSQDYEYVFMPPVFQNSEDDYFSFQPPITKVNEDESPYNSIPQAISFYFTDLDTEEFDWAFQQGPAKVSEDDAPYDSLVRQITFTPEIEDEQINWGFKPPVTLTSQDDSPYNNLIQQMSYYFSDSETEQFDWGFNLPVVVVQAPFDTDDQFSITMPVFAYESDDARIVDWSPSVDEVQLQSSLVLSDTESDQFGFNPPVITIGLSIDFAIDQLPIAQYLISDDVDTFGFSLPFIQEDSINPSSTTLLVFQDDADQFGFNSPQISADDGIDQLPSITFVYDEVDVFGLQPPFTQLGSISAEQDFFPNPPYPTIIQVEDEQSVIEIPLPVTLGDAWENLGFPSNPPWPVLDNVDYNDFIKQVNFIIPIYLSITTSPVVVLGLVFTSPALAFVESVDTNTNIAIAGLFTQSADMAMAKTVTTNSKITFAGIVTELVG